MTASPTSWNDRRRLWTGLEWREAAGWAYTAYWMIDRALIDRVPRPPLDPSVPGLLSQIGPQEVRRRLDRIAGGLLSSFPAKIIGPGRTYGYDPCDDVLVVSLAHTGPTPGPIRVGFNPSWLTGIAAHCQHLDMHLNVSTSSVVWWDHRRKPRAALLGYHAPVISQPPPTTRCTATDRTYRCIRHHNHIGPHDYHPT